MNDKNFHRRETRSYTPPPDALHIKQLFGTIASTYDRANNRMTFGLVHRWRRKLVHWSDSPRTANILDCATGTGDVALAFRKILGPKPDITGIDSCEQMLELARKKDQIHQANIRYLNADILNLPFADASFDVISIAYGMRNVINLNRAMSEMTRVIRPGGVLLILETGKAQASIPSMIIKAYMRYIIPLTGGWPDGQLDAYRYLSRSSLSFPSGTAFVKLMERYLPVASSIQHKRLFSGASYLYRASF